MSLRRTMTSSMMLFLCACGSEVADATDDAQLGESQAPLTVVSLLSPTVLEVPERVALYGDTVQFRATLKTALGGAPLANRLVKLSAGGIALGQTTTDAQGVATLQIKPTQLGIGTKTMTWSFAGDSTYSGASKSASLKVLRQNTSMVTNYGWDATKGYWETLSLKTYVDNVAVPLGGRPVEFIAAGAVLGSGMTNANGSLTIWKKPASVTGTLYGSFAGDTFYAPSGDYVDYQLTQLMPKYRAVVKVSQEYQRNGNTVAVSVSLQRVDGHSFDAFNVPFRLTAVSAATGPDWSKAATVASMNTGAFGTTGWQEIRVIASETAPFYFGNDYYALGVEVDGALVTEIVPGFVDVHENPFTIVQHGPVSWPIDTPMTIHYDGFTYYYANGPDMPMPGVAIDTPCGEKILDANSKASCTVTFTKTSGKPGPNGSRCFAAYTKDSDALPSGYTELCVLPQ